jgi:hypothetical protein
LPNDSFELELLRPRSDTNDSLVYISVEQIQFSGATPWPPGADGLGLSLQRIDLESFGNDPINWTAAAPTPGGGLEGGTLPQITSQPGNRIVLTGTDQILSIEATGPNLRYQWRFMDEPLIGATNATLVLNNIQVEQSGVYNVLVFNGGGGVLGTNFTLIARVKTQVIRQPQAQIAILQGTTTNISVSAIGSGILHYQWFYNGSPLGGATSTNLVLVNLQPSNDGSYHVTVTDDYETVASEISHVQVVFKPVITLQPMSFAVVEGQTAVFTVEAIGTEPISFKWRSSTNNGPSSYLSNPLTVEGRTNSFLLFPNVPYSTNVIRITAAITNIAGQAPATVAGLLTVLKDTDHDGLPDVWEATHGFNTNNAADGLRDDDGDGMSNAAEYLAGTDYLNRTSYLKAEILPGGAGHLQFLAISNRTYTVQYSDRLDAAVWRKLTDVPADKTSQMQPVVDPNITSNSNRFYRLVIPIQP